MTKIEAILVIILVFIPNFFLQIRINYLEKAVEELSKRQLDNAKVNLEIAKTFQLQAKAFELLTTKTN